MQIAVVTHIFGVKQAEQQARETATEKAAQKQKLLSIIAEKQEADLRGKSVQDLMEMVNNL